MGRPKKVIEGVEEVKEPIEIVEKPVEAVKLSEKEELEVIYKFMKDRGINSISDIENKIARS